MSHGKVFPSPLHSVRGYPFQREASRNIAGLGLFSSGRERGLSLRIFSDRPKANICTPCSVVDALTITPTLRSSRGMLLMARVGASLLHRPDELLNFIMISDKEKHQLWRRHYKNKSESLIQPYPTLEKGL